MMTMISSEHDILLQQLTLTVCGYVISHTYNETLTLCYRDASGMLQIGVTVDAV